MKKLLIIISLLSAVSFCEAQYDTIHNFNNTQGLAPEYCALTYSASTNLFYGMVPQGGPSNDGVLFCIHPNGSGFKILLNFTGVNGNNPGGSLVLSGYKLYGMTQKGGTNNYGCVFSIDTNGGGYKDLWNFNAPPSTNGEFPYGDVTLFGGKLFGMTSGGGTHSFGNIFSIDTSGGGYKDLWDFNFGVGTNGSSPSGSLTLVGKQLYGMTKQGGANFNGNIFRIDTSGTGFTTLWSFNSSADTNGGDPYGNLLLVGPKFYGLTNTAGRNGFGNVFSIDTNGAKYHDIWDFASAGVDTNGSGSTGSLVIHKGSLYGMTTQGAKYGKGNVFKIDTNGKGFKDLADFDGAANPCGSTPYGSLTRIGNTFYGMTSIGGSHNDGVIFSYLDTTIASGVNNIMHTEGSINIYPNPGKGKFTLENKGPEISSGELDVYNVIGEKVYQASISDFRSSINLSLDVPNGVYFLSLKSEKGIINSKIVVQK